MEILSKISSSADVKKLPEGELDALCGELRESIISAVAANGGHLGSNLGAVELTVALHRVYDTAVDRVVFDVGHQCYAHKMLTGRLDRFGTLRSFGGLSGFPKPCESRDDACIAGHASNSISMALGMARARTLSGGTYKVAAVIGDGAMTGGLAYEGLADCGESGESIVVILNDNGMSINSNVGGMAHLLSQLRVKPSYLAVKRAYHRTIGRCRPLYNALHKVKERIKDIFLPDNMFENMGFYYLGPIDGHDVRTLERTLAYAGSMNRPVLVHVTTVKGKGYTPAEAEPERYHGVGAFDVKEGVRLSSEERFSSVFGEELVKLAAGDERIVAVTAAMAGGTGLDGFARRWPQRFFDVGIAEEHAAVMSAGMAKQGLRPVFAVYSSFLQRSFDMLIHDVALDSLPVVLAVDRAGLVGADGETHQGSFDVGFLRQVPGMRIFSPSSFAEMRSMLRLAMDGRGPAAIRYPRGGEGRFTGDTSKTDEAVLREGKDATIVTYGVNVNDALLAAEKLASEGIAAAVIKLNRLDADEFPLCADSVRNTGALVAVEETCAHGCIGVRLTAYMALCGIACDRVRLLNLGSGVVPHGDVKKLRALCGIDAEAIAAAVRSLEVSHEKSQA